MRADVNWESGQDLIVEDVYEANPGTSDDNDTTVDDHPVGK
jgi:hypothetical protein